MSPCNVVRPFAEQCNKWTAESAKSLANFQVYFKEEGGPGNESVMVAHFIHSSAVLRAVVKRKKLIKRLASWQGSDAITLV